MNEEALKKLARRIALETYAAWEEHECKGIAAAVPHLENALRDLARCGISPNKSSFSDWLCRRASGLWVSRRKAAVRAMGFAGSPAHQKLLACLRRRLRSRNWRAKRDALTALRQLEVSSREEGLFSVVAQELHNRHVAVRVAAAHLLISWERQAGKPSLPPRVPSRKKRRKNTAYLLDLARSLALTQEAQARVDAPPLALNANTVSSRRSDQPKQEIERLLERLLSFQPADRQRAARALGERMQAGCRVFERQGRLVILLPYDFNHKNYNIK